MWLIDWWRRNQSYVPCENNPGFTPKPLLTKEEIIRTNCENCKHVWGKWHNGITFQWRNCIHCNLEVWKDICIEP